MDHTPLTEDEQRTVAERAAALNRAIRAGATEAVLSDLHLDLQRAYRGEARALLDEFAAASDKAAWSRALRAALAEDVEDSHWIAAAEVGN